MSTVLWCVQLVSVLSSSVHVHNHWSYSKSYSGHPSPQNKQLCVLLYKCSWDAPVNLHIA